MVWPPLAEAMLRWDPGPAMSPLVDAPPVTLSCLLLGHETDPRGMTTCTSNHTSRQIKRELAATACIGSKQNAWLQLMFHESKDNNDWSQSNIYNNYNYCGCGSDVKLPTGAQNMYGWLHTVKTMLTLPLNQTSFNSSAKAMYQATAAVQIPK